MVVSAALSFACVRDPYLCPDKGVVLMPDDSFSDHVPGDCLTACRVADGRLGY